jgi:hypothetical protein
MTGVKGLGKQRTPARDELNKSKLEAEWKRDEKATDGAPEVVFN